MYRYATRNVSKEKGCSMLPWREPLRTWVWNYCFVVAQRYTTDHWETQDVAESGPHSLAQLSAKRGCPPLPARGPVQTPIFSWAELNTFNKCMKSSASESIKNAKLNSNASVVLFCLAQPEISAWEWLRLKHRTFHEPNRMGIIQAQAIFKMYFYGFLPSRTAESSPPESTPLQRRTTEVELHSN